MRKPIWKTTWLENRFSKINQSFRFLKNSSFSIKSNEYFKFFVQEKYKKLNVKEIKSNLSVMVFQIDFGDDRFDNG